MKALIVSHTHHLLPLAWRLHQEGWQIDLIVDRDAYERAWSGRFDPKLRNKDKRSRHAMKMLRKQAEEEGTLVLTDSPKWNEEFAGLPTLYGFVPRPETANRLPPILVGAWFDGEAFSARHLLVEDQGLWPGGLGPDTLGGVTLVAPRAWPEVFEVALQRVKDELKAREYRGLVKVGLQINPQEPGEPVMVGYQAGWNFLQVHALLSEAGDEGTPSLTKILQGEEPQFLRRFTMALPMSIPPYPYRAAVGKPADSLPIPTAAVKSGRFYWHDMLVEGGVVMTAGLDGLVAVLRASADNFALVNNKLLAYGRLLALPQLQVRMDVGSQVEFFLGLLEERGMAV